MQKTNSVDFFFSIFACSKTIARNEAVERFMHIKQKCKFIYFLFFEFIWREKVKKKRERRRKVRNLGQSKAAALNARI
jgi:hypothetical protein